VDGRWTEPEIAPFSGSNKFYDFEPHISPDGKHFYFLSTRPQKGQEPKAGWVYQDIWVMDKTNGGWSEPYNIGEPVNTEDGEYYPSVTKSGTLYFTREAHNKNSIYRSKFVKGKFQMVERVNIPVDSANIYNAFVSPDESYLIFCSSELKDKIGNIDYYISFHVKDSIWSKPVNMGNKVNRKEDAASSAFVTRDGKYLFFASNRMQSTQGKAIYKDLIEMVNKPGNGSTDIYWIKADFIEGLRALSYKP
jgi:Tol biopolymer transport system component